MKNIRILILIFSIIFLSSCSENWKITWQNKKNINNSELEGYIERNDEGEMLDESEIVESNKPQNSVTSDENPINF